MRSVLASIVATIVVGGIVLVAVPARADADDADLTLSYTLEAKRDTAGAIKAMKRAVAAAPKVYFLQIRLGYLDALVGDSAGAADAYHAASVIAPLAIEPVLGEQLALATAGKWSEALVAGRKAMSLDPLNYLGRSRFAWALYKHKDFGAAMLVYRALLELYPGDLDMRVGLGWSLLFMGKNADAAATFQQVLTMVPKHASALEGLAAASK